MMVNCSIHAHGSLLPAHQQVPAAEPRAFGGLAGHAPEAIVNGIRADTERPRPGFPAGPLTAASYSA
jgi:hypothetical protein